MSESNRRNVLLAIAGAGLLIGAAFLFHWANQGEEDTVDLREEIKAQGLDKVVKKDGKLETNYFLKLLQFIGVENKARMAKLGLVKERRKAFREKNMDQYKSLAMKELQMNDQ